jgi:hypothetical protein
VSTETLLAGAITYVPTIALAVALAASAGLRAWLPLLATGVLARLDVLQLGESFAFLESTPALVVFGVATVLEIAADKIPVLDHGLDVVSTVLRPAAGALLTAGVMWQVNDPMWAAGIGIILGAPIAAAPHLAKSTARVASTTATGGIANPFVSLLEDLASAFMIVLAVLLPILAVLLLAVVAFFVVRFVMRRRRATVAT